MRGIWSRLTSDEGMTLVEIIVASAILLVVLMALIPFAYQTTLMTSQSTAQTKATNYVSAFIERVRAMPYEQVGIVGSAVLPGSLESTITGPLGDGYTITMALAVEWVDDLEMTGTENYKQLNIDATVNAPGRNPISYSTSTFIWGSPYSTGDVVPPSVSFGAVSPDPLEVVSGTSVPLSGTASTSMVGGFISSMSLKVDSSYVPNSVLDTAQFSPMENPADTGMWLWDTTAVLPLKNEDGTPLLDEDGHPVLKIFSMDGKRLLMVEAWDNLGAYNYATREVIVDNYAPKMCASATAEAYRSRTVRALWAEAADGTDPAYAYNVALFREGGTEALSTTGVQQVTAAEFTADPFSRYYYRVQSESIGGKVEADEWTTSNTVTTAPELTGTFTQTVTKSGNGSKAKYTLSTSTSTDVTNPGFATDGAVTYTLWRSTNPADLGVAGKEFMTVAYDAGVFKDTITDATVYSSGAQTPGYYYLVRATFDPAGGADEDVVLFTNRGFVPGVKIPSSAATYTGTMEMQW